MGLAEDLTALQELREKEELTEAAYIAARERRRLPLCHLMFIPSKEWLIILLALLGVVWRHDTIRPLGRCARP